MIDSLLWQLEQDYRVRLTQDGKKKVEVYLRLLRTWNRRMNLTSVETLEDQLRLHFFESFWVAERFLGQATALADVGSGAGFPGLAMKLYRPSLEVTLIEKNLKKVVFLREVSRALELKVETYQGRAESYPDWFKIEIATLRALKPSPELVDIWGRRQVKLLWLHTKNAAVPGADFRLLQQEKIPHSADRYATLCLALRRL